MTDLSKPLCQRDGTRPEPGWHCTTPGEDHHICVVKPDFDGFLNELACSPEPTP